MSLETLSIKDDEESDKEQQQQDNNLSETEQIHLSSLLHLIGDHKYDKQWSVLINQVFSDEECSPDMESLCLTLDKLHENPFVLRDLDECDQEILQKYQDRLIRESAYVHALLDVMTSLDFWTYRMDQEIKI